MAEQDNIYLAQQELAAELGLSSASSGEEWTRQLVTAINQLIQTDFNRLVHILYRMDVSESRLKQVLQQEAGADAGELIARLMVERQLQKMAARNQFRTSHDIPDDEKW